MKTDTIRFATFLAPNVYPVYECVADYVGKQLGWRTELISGESFAAFERGEVDVGFICGLPYVQLTRSSEPPVELLAAPVLQGERYGGLPIYFPDVVVRKDSPYRAFAELRGCAWAYIHTRAKHHTIHAGADGGNAWVLWPSGRGGFSSGGAADGRGWAGGRFGD